MAEDKNNFDQVISNLDCKDIFEFKAQFWLSLKLREGKASYLDKIMKKCPQPNALYPLFYNSKNNINSKKAKDYGDSKEENLFEISEKLINFFKSSEKCQNVESFQFCKEIDRLIKDKPQNILFNHLATLVLAMKSQNVVWAKSSVLKILNTDYSSYALTNPNSWQINFSNNKLSMAPEIFNFLTELKKFLKDDFLFQLYLTYWSHYLKGMDFDRVRGGLGGILTYEDWHKKDLKNYGGDSLELFDNYLKNGDHLSWYENHFSPELIDFHTDEDLIRDYLLLYLMKNEKLKKKLEILGKNFKEPLFNLEHDFYLRLYRSGNASDFAIFHLLKLGDEKWEFLDRIIM